MVQLTRHEPVAEYRILDGQGRPIGRVLDPALPPRLGPGEQTVLLVR
jgi:hypothetical protein